MSEEVGPPRPDVFISSPGSPGGTVIVDGIETVTVEKTRLPDWGKWLAILGVAIAAYLLLTRKARRR
jgi:hypothetical protein